MDIKLIIEISIGVILFTFLLFGLLKNYKFALIQLILFLGIFITLKIITPNLIQNNENIKELIEKVCINIQDFIDNFNNTITNFSNEYNLNLPLIDDSIINNNFIEGTSYSLINLVLIIIYSLISYLGSLLLTIIIYSIIDHFLKKKVNYKEKTKKFYYRLIGIIPNLLLGMVSISLIITPIYSLKKVSNEGLTYVSEIDLESKSNVYSKYNEYKNKIDEYYIKFDDLENLLNSIKNDVDYLKNEVDELTIVVDSFELDKYKELIDDICKYPGNLSSEDKLKANNIQKELDNYISIYNTKYNEFKESKEEIDNTFNNYYDGFNQIENYRQELKDIENNLNTIDLKEINEIINKAKEYKEYLNKYIPELTVFKFLIIDLNYSEIKYNNTTYNLNNSMNQIVNYIEEYLNKLNEEISNVTNEKFNEIDKEIENADKLYKENYDKIKEEVDNFSKEKYEEELSIYKNEISSYKEKYDELVKNINELDKKR